MKTLSEQDLEKNIRIFNALIGSMSEKRQEDVKLLMDNMQEQFFLAPASSREDFHNCFAGGLLLHSLNVVKNLKKISASLVGSEYDDQTLAFVGLFHDLGKAGDGVEPYYVYNENEYGRKRGFLYEINKKCQIHSTEDRTLFIFQRFGVSLNSDEYLALKLSDGQYVEANKIYGMKESKLALLLHWADRWSCEQERT
jgi:hypothetical protein